MLTMQKQKLCYLCPSLVLFLFSSALLSSGAELCNPTEKEALLEIKHSLGNPHILRSWTPNTDCCKTWYKVACDSQSNRVIWLKVQYSHLVGQISPAIGRLTSLQIVSFYKLPNLYGTIPQSITNLKNLQFLELAHANLTGPIPLFLTQIHSLTDLLLTDNQFSGSIPPSLVQLANLENLSLDRNKLIGSIPENFGSFRNPILYLTLSGNQLSGPIPRSLANGNFSTLDLSRNKLAGDAAFLFGNGKLFEIDLNGNSLSFDLSNVKFYEYLQHIDISRNKIYGRIPTSLTKLMDLHYLNVSYNSLCGPIPAGGLLQSFNETSYFHNKCLCGAPLLSCK
ncbi:hypothetical protein Nepgr_021958 [Nepenthes gracilis]|uniref:Leucine-rich repeat-containing N-terminal plant-type domain-containing protein n=1 Tax=Nepenthes gracilis TaxID=150966 RepID=A0AAD3T0X6_NEPGR|nr:hypothetical protein Nepgr_021958 [Nepenthes gracilis]